MTLYKDWRALLVGNWQAMGGCGQKPSLPACAAGHAPRLQLPVLPMDAGVRGCSHPRQAPGHTGTFLSGTNTEAVVTPRQALVEPWSPWQRGIPESGRIPQGQQQTGCIHPAEHGAQARGRINEVIMSICKQR